MGQQAVIADRNADILTEDPEHDKRRKSLPGEEEKGSKRKEMKEPERNGEDPFKGPAVLLRHPALGGLMAWKRRGGCKFNF
jgi:hypothetical protein